MMSRKNYVAMAAALKAARPRAKCFEGCKVHAPTPAELATWHTCVMAAADVFALDNPRFDRERFAAACGYDMQGEQGVK